eukprot:ctg_2307.g568
MARVPHWLRRGAALGRSCNIPTSACPAGGVWIRRSGVLGRHWMAAAERGSSSSSSSSPSSTSEGGSPTRSRASSRPVRPGRVSASGDGHGTAAVPATQFSTSRVLTFQEAIFRLQAVRASGRLAVWREPEPHSAAHPVPGHPQAVSAQLPRPAAGLVSGAWCGFGGARHPLRGGQLGVAGAGCLGTRLRGVDGRLRDHPVHLLSAGGRPAYRVRAGHIVWRDLSAERGGDEPLPPGRGGHRAASRTVRDVRGRGAGADWQGVAGARVQRPVACQSCVQRVGRARRHRGHRTGAILSAHARSGAGGGRAVVAAAEGGRLSVVEDGERGIGLGGWRGGAHVGVAASIIPIDTRSGCGSGHRMSYVGGGHRRAAARGCGSGAGAAAGTDGRVAEGNAPVAGGTPRGDCHSPIRHPAAPGRGGRAVATAPAGSPGGTARAAPAHRFRRRHRCPDRGCHRVLPAARHRQRGRARSGVALHPTGRVPVRCRARAVAHSVPPQHALERVGRAVLSADPLAGADARRSGGAAAVRWADRHGSDVWIAHAGGCVVECFECVARVSLCGGGAAAVDARVPVRRHNARPAGHRGRRGATRGAGATAGTTVGRVAGRRAARSAGRDPEGGGASGRGTARHSGHIRRGLSDTARGGADHGDAQTPALLSHSSSGRPERRPGGARAGAAVERVRGGGQRRARGRGHCAFWERSSVAGALRRRQVLLRRRLPHPAGDAGAATGGHCVSGATGEHAGQDAAHRGTGADVVRGHGHHGERARR